MDNFYNKEIKEIYNYFNSSEQGLSTKIVEKNLKKYGTNIIKEKEKKYRNLSISKS